MFKPFPSIFIMKHLARPGDVIIYMVTNGIYRRQMALKCKMFYSYLHHCILASKTLVNDYIFIILTYFIKPTSSKMKAYFKEWLTKC